jgi:hypothetical protein
VSALDTHRHFQAYSHNGDDKELARLGLKTNAFKARDAEDSWLDLGTVVVQEAREEMTGDPKTPTSFPACTVRVEVACYPAQFWRFTIDRYDEKLTGDVAGGGEWGVEVRPERFILRTGSGGFSDYWEIAEAFARNMVDVEVVTDVAGD